MAVSNIPQSPELHVVGPESNPNRKVFVDSRRGVFTDAPELKEKLTDSEIWEIFKKAFSCHYELNVDKLKNEESLFAKAVKNVLPCAAFNENVPNIPLTVGLFRKFVTFGEKNYYIFSLSESNVRERRNNGLLNSEGSRSSKIGKSPEKTALPNVPSFVERSTAEVLPQNAVEELLPIPQLQVTPPPTPRNMSQRPESLPKASGDKYILDQQCGVSESLKLHDWEAPIKDDSHFRVIIDEDGNFCAENSESLEKSSFFSCCSADIVKDKSNQSVWNEFKERFQEELGDALFVDACHQSLVEIGTVPLLTPNLFIKIVQYGLSQFNARGDERKPTLQVH